MHRRTLPIALLLILCADVAAAASFSDVYRVRAVAGHYSGTYESLAIREVTSRAGTFWMAERRTRTTAGITGPTKLVERVWIDGRRCPALKTVVQSISNLSTASPPQTPPPFHGARVNLATLGPDGAYSVQSDYEGPITAWWRDAGKALAPCWGAPIAMVDDGLLPLTLETDADEAPFKALEQNR